MHVVLALGMLYLWVDKFCINQSNPIEMHTQLSVMDRIYESAQFTIIAAVGNASYGLPGVKTTLRNPQSRVTINGKTWLSSLHGWKYAERSQWSSRAWTYQEGLCSGRRLIFTAEQVLFECNVTDLHETINRDLSRIDHSTTRVRESRPGYFKGGLKTLHESLVTHIKTYTKRQLSCQSDILNVMRGMFERYSRCEVPVHSYWGIPCAFAAYHAEGYWRNYCMGLRRPLPEGF
jgi:hypothetical protein